MRPWILAPLAVGGTLAGLFAGAAHLHAQPEGPAERPPPAAASSGPPSTAAPEAVVPPPGPPPVDVRIAPPAEPLAGRRPEGWSPPRRSRVSAGVLARAASRRAQEHGDAACPVPPAPVRGGCERAEDAIESIEIDWHAGNSSP